MVFKILDGSFCGIMVMDMRGQKLVEDLLIKEGIIKEITRFIIYYMELGLVSTSCEFVKDFLDPFVDACP